MGMLVTALIVLAPYCVLVGVQRARRAWWWFGAWLVLFALTTVSVWFFLVSLPLWIAVAIDAVRCKRKSSEPVRLVQIDVLIFVVISGLLAFASRTLVLEAFKIPASSMCPTLHIGDHIFVEKLSKLWRPYQRGDVVVFVYPCDPGRDYIKRVIALGGDTVEVRCNVVYVNGKAVPSQLIEPDCHYDDYYEDEPAPHWQVKRCSRYRETVNGNSYDSYHDEDRPARDERRKNGIPIGPDSRDFPRREDPIVPSCHGAADWYPDKPNHQILGKLVETKPGESAGACEPQLHYVVPDDHLFVLGDNRANSNDSRVWGSVPISSVKGRAVGIWMSHGPHGLEWSRLGAVH